MKKRYIFLLVILVLVLVVPIVFRALTIYPKPSIVQETVVLPKLQKIDSITVKMGNNWLRKNALGNWECYVEGAPYERGLILGKMQKALIKKQEAVFVKEIENKLPNVFFRHLMQTGVQWFNRNLDEQVPQEFLEEIYGVSQSFADTFDYIGPKFNRVLNYHAAHDIGHMAQNMNLVACSAIAQWDYGTAGEERFLLGRNFDFYFGDDFAKNKIVLFCKPDSGFAFTSVTWGGFCGVVSGMNEKGLSVTLNALPSEVPTSANTPVSIIARQVLQYAATIDEAYKIVASHGVFVSESFTIASAADRKAAVIEKTPDTTGIFIPDTNQLIVTNHFQSSPMNASEINAEHIKNSESMNRYLRLREMSKTDTARISSAKMASFLRDTCGAGGTAIGMGNPAAINQFLAHHAVIFDPINLVALVSAAPFQINAFSAYSLKNMGALANHNPVEPISIDSLQVAKDVVLQSPAYHKLEDYRALKKQLANAPSAKFTTEELSEFIRSNPNYFETYKLVGDYFAAHKNATKAVEFYQMALDREIPYKSDRQAIEEKIEALK